MDWKLAIETNREALKRILAALVAMAGFDSSAGFSDAAGFAPTLPRHLHRAVLRLLRPAEAAARRLVIVAARDIVVTPARPRQRKPGPAPIFLRRGSGGTGIVPPPGFAPPPLAPPHKGEGNFAAAPQPADADNFGGAAAPASPSPLWGGVRGGGRQTPARRLGFRLFDPLPRNRPRHPRQGGVPRISLPGFTSPSPVPVRREPLPDDPVDAVRLGLRLSALGRVLDDLPRQARRFARWRAGVARQAKKIGRRIWPLKPGLPAGVSRPGRPRRKAHEIYEILKNSHGLALYAMAQPDTS